VQHATLQERLDKAESEILFLQTQLSNIKRQRDGLSERYGMLQKSLASTDNEARRCVPRRPDGV
jgi:chromosome segregation ATPase